jgi:UDP-N-acetylmuramoylalanine--D-glutamate ligase
MKKVAILGFGIEGKDVLGFLEEEEADITVFDSKDKRELDLTGIDTNRIKFSLGPDYLKDGLASFDMIVRSPGVYRYLPEIVDAEDKGVEITSAIKIFFENCPGKIIGVTGTKGKGTTSSLIYEILKKDEKDVHLSGNIGKPCLELLDVLDSDSWIVLELSSFQLMDLNKSPDIAVVLNITVDHLDWHKDTEEYVSAKRNIVKFQKEEDFSVINADYEITKDFEELGQSQKYFFSKLDKVKGCFIRDGYIILSTNGDEEIIGDVQKLLLKGSHNWENITAAVCASYLAGASLKSIIDVIFSFKGLEHRLELAGEVNEVKFYNDSFATGPQPTIAAINSFIEPETLILGGSDKGLDYSELGKTIAEKDNIQNIILIGQIRDQIAASFKGSSFKGKVFDMGISSMPEIVKKAHEITPQGGVVILSPAAASFDMFKNYKDRGNQFKAAVMNLRNEQ